MDVQPKPSAYKPDVAEWPDIPDFLDRRKSLCDLTGIAPEGSNTKSSDEANGDDNG